MEDPNGNVAAAAAAITEALDNKSPEHVRRKSDGVNYSMSDFEKAVEVLKELHTKEHLDAETIEAVGELEDKRLGHWLVKAAVFSIAAVAVLFVMAVGWSIITGNPILLPDYVTGALKAIEDVVFAIFETKVPNE